MDGQDWPPHPWPAPVSNGVAHAAKSVQVTDGEERRNEHEEVRGQWKQGGRDGGAMPEWCPCVWEHSRGKVEKSE